MDWFLYDRDLRHERVNKVNVWFIILSLDFIFTLRFFSCKCFICSLNPVFDFANKSSHFNLKILNSLSKNYLMPPCKFCKIFFLKLINLAFLSNESVYVSILLLFDFSRVLSFSFSRNTKPVLKSKLELSVGKL